MPYYPYTYKLQGFLHPTFKSGYKAGENRLAWYPGKVRPASRPQQVEVSTRRVRCVCVWFSYLTNGRTLNFLASYI